MKEIKFLLWCSVCENYFDGEEPTKQEKELLKSKKIQTVIDVFVCDNCIKRSD